MAGFKDLQVWQKGMDLVELVYEACSKLPVNEQYGLCSQMKRAVVSIPSNLAEEYRRNNKKEFHHFCGIALGSAAELETQLIITKRIYPTIDVELSWLERRNTKNAQFSNQETEALTLLSALITLP